MADNIAVTPGTGATVASDEATYSGDTAKVQVIRQVHVDGSEGSKTVKELVRLEDAAHTTGDPGIPALGVRQDTAASLAGTDGDYTMPIFDASGRQHVNVGNTVTVASHAVTNAGTFAVQATGTVDLGATDNAVLDAIAASVAAIDTDTSTIITNTGAATTALQIMDDWDNGASDGASVSGDVAHDTADAGEPVKIGAQARKTNPTAVADADRVNFIADKLGKQVVVGSIRDLKSNQQTTITASTSETTIITADATNFLDVYGLTIANTSTTYTTVTIKDATAGTTRFVFAVPAQQTVGFMLPESAAHKQATANNNWTATCGTSVSSINITALFVKNL